MSIPAIHQGFSRIGVDVTTFFTTSASGQSPDGQQHRSSTARAADQPFGYPTGGDRFSSYSGQQASGAAPRQTTIAIEMESSSGKLPQTPRCLSC